VRDVEFKEPYLRTWRYAKDHSRDLGMLIVANILFIFAMQAVSMVAIFTFYGILGIILPIVVIGGIAMMGLGTVGTALGIILMALSMMLTLALFMAFLVLIWGISFGWQVLLSESVLDISDGRRADLSLIISEVKDRWKELFRKGLGIGIRYLLAVMAVILVPTMPILVLTAVLIFSSYSAEALELTLILALVISVYSLFLTVGIILITPAMAFVMDRSAIRVARGQTPKRGFSGAIRDLKRRRELLGHFYIGYLASALLGLIFPLSIIIQFALPVASKTFLIVNDPAIPQ